MKLRYELLDKLLLENRKKIFSRAEMTLLFFLIKNQDNKGYVHSLRIREICEITGIAYWGCYKAIRSLVDRKIIEGVKNPSTYGEWIFGVCCNCFNEQEESGIDFMKLPNGILKTEEFPKLEPGAQLFILLILREMDNQGEYNIKCNTFWEEYGKCLNVQQYTMRVYLKRSRKYFDIQYLHKTFWFQMKESVLTEQ